MSGPGFGVDDDGLRGRAEELGRIGDALREAGTAAVAAGSPDAYGVLCSFFPTLLDPVAAHALDALERAAASCGDAADELRAAGGAFTGTDDAGAAGFGR